MTEYKEYRRCGTFGYSIVINGVKDCPNRKSADVRRARITPDEICELTVNFYKRNYIEAYFALSVKISRVSAFNITFYQLINICLQFKLYIQN